MPKKVPIDKEKIFERIEDIEDAIEELKKYQAMSSEKFLKDEKNFHWSCYWLRIGIEAVLVIGTHILSRLPFNGRKKDYTQIILSLADYEVLPKEFAQRFKDMAKIRNRLVHLYWRMTPEEILTLIKERLGEFNEFINYIKEFLKKL